MIVEAFVRSQKAPGRWTMLMRMINKNPKNFMNKYKGDLSLWRLAVDNFLLLIQYAAVGLIPIILIPHVIRNVNLANYGVLAVSMAWANYASIAVNYAFTLSGPARIVHAGVGESTGNILSLIISAKSFLFIFTLLVIVVSLMVCLWSGVPISGPQVWILIAVPVAATLNLTWYLQAVDKFHLASASSIVAVAAALAAGLYWDDNSMGKAALALTMAPLLVGAGSFILSVRHLHRQGESVRWMKPWAELRNGFPLFVSQLMATLYSGSGSIIIGHFCGYGEAGAYSVIEKVTSAIVGGCLLVFTAGYPKLARLFRANELEYWRLLRMIVMIYLALAASAVSLVCVNWSQVVAWILGEGGMKYELTLAGALVWIIISIFGPVLTGHLTVSGRGYLVLPLTSLILMISFAVGVPGLLFYGSWTWFFSLSVAQTMAFLLFFCVNLQNIKGRHEVQ
jgi:O-antigen/teichoic acid export membrane protein